MGGRLNDPVTFKSCAFGVRDERVKRRDNPRFFRLRGNAHVDLGRRPRRHDVGGRAPLDHADIDRGSRGQVLQCLEFQDLVGELDDGASTVLREPTPAWAALPSTSSRNRPTPLREVLSPPSARAGSSTKT